MNSLLFKKQEHTLCIRPRLFLSCVLLKLKHFSHNDCVMNICLSCCVMFNLFTCKWFLILLIGACCRFLGPVPLVKEIFDLDEFISW